MDRDRSLNGDTRWLMYYLQTTVNIVLITIYSKTEQADISTAQIRRIVDEFRGSE